MKVSTKYLLIIFAVISLLIGIVIYLYLKKKTVRIPEGYDIPAGWSALPTAIILYNSMAGVGTDESAFFNALEPLNLAQRAMVYNAYNEKYGNLLSDIENDFSGTDLQRALSYFRDIPGVDTRFADEQKALYRFQRSVVSLA